MKELLYTILELESWNEGSICCFCSGLNESVCQIRTRNKVTHSIVENDYACENCKEKFENDELSKCEDCGRLKTQLNINALSGKYICNCLRNNESQEKELPVLPHEERASTRYERQINGLREKLTTAEETIEEERAAHEDFMKTSEEWGKRQKQELLDKIKKLEEENKQLREEKKVELYEKEIEELKQQLEKLNSQLIARVETPPKNGGIKGFFKFGGKK